MGKLIRCVVFFVGLLFASLVSAQTYAPMVPVRLLDTRPGNTTVDGQFAGSGPVASWSTTNLTVLGRAGIPSSGVSAVALNITVTNPAGAGFLTAWPAGSPLPNASNLNFVAGLSISNQVIAKVGTNGQVSIYVYAGGGSANVVADVAGYFPSNSDLTPLTPARLLDTRAGMATVDGQYAGGGAVAAGGTLNLPVLGRGGVPGSGVRAVVVNVTGTGPTGSTFITAWPSGNARPNASNLNLIAGQTIPNLVVVAPGSGGAISLYNNVGSTDLIVDVVGFFSSSSTLVPLVPARLLDTRPGTATIDGQFVGQGAVGSGGTLNLTVAGRGGVPGSGVGAVALNVTAVVPTAAGYVVAWGTGTTSGPPQAMDINFNAGNVIPSLVIAQVGANGQVSLYNSNGSTHLIADVVGWLPSAPPTSSNVMNYMYDNNGQLIAASNATDARQYSYDNHGNLYAVTVTGVFTSSLARPVRSLFSTAERLIAATVPGKKSGGNAAVGAKTIPGKNSATASNVGLPSAQKKPVAIPAQNRAERMAFSLPPSAEVQRVLLADGRTLEIHGAQGLAYLIDGIKRQNLSLPEPRRYASATAMPGGQVLLWGGVDTRGKVIPTGEWFDPASQLFTPTGELGMQARAGHTLTVLTDGQILLSGGWGADGAPIGTSALWQPASHKAAAVKGGSDIRLAGSAILQADGTVRIEGGVNASGKVLAAATYFDPRVSKMGMKPQLAAEYAAQAIATFPADRSLAASLHGPLVLRFAKPVNVRELNTDAVTLIGPTGPVTAKVMATNEGRLAFVQVPDDLYPGSRYTLFVKGLHAADGTPLSDTIAGFATQASPATSVMLAGDGNRRTVPDQRASSGQPPLVVMTGDGKGCPGATDELCREHSFIRDGAWYPGNDNIPDATGGHWRLYQARSTLPDTSAMESALPAGTTALIGQIRQIDEKPVANVEVSIGARKVRTDINGVFVLKDVPAGRQEVFVDGRSAGKDQKQYGRFVVGADVGAKAINHMPFVMYLPRVLPRDEVTLPAPTTQEVVVTHPDMPGLEVHIPPGTVLRDREGKVLTKIAIVPTPVDRAPFPLPDNFPMYFTVQPSDAVIQGLTAQAGQGIRVVYPNYGKAAPRTQGNFWVYDVQAGWKMYGGGHVTDDAKHLAPDPGVSLVWTVGAGASLGNSEPPTANRPGGACAADPIDLQTGIFYHEWADLVINDVVPLVLKRSFNSADTVSHAFGVGSSSNFGMHLYSSDGSYTQPQLVLDCGQGIAFDLTAGTATYPFSGTVWTHTKSATGYYGAKLQFLGYWLVTLRSGFQYAFEAHAPNRLQWTKDRFGNQTQYSYNAGLINQITSPSGRTLAFSYDTSNRIATATDNTGRVVKYTYNATMFDGTSTGTTALGTVTYPDNTTEKYTYRNCSGFSCTLRTTMQDRKGNTYLTNDYYSQNCPAFGPCNGISWRRVSRQTLADGTSYGFSYTTSGNNVTATQVTKPNGNSDYYTFDSVSGYPLAVTRGYGTSLAQTTSYSRAASGLVSSQTDPLGRVTTYAYDTLGNVASITALAGTANAAIVTYTYTSDYNQIASITDPLGHVTQFGYTAGCLTSVTNALNNITRFVCNGSGQPTAVTDPLGHTTTLAYSGKDLSAVNSPLNQLITYTTDALGRLTAVQDPLGRTSTIQPDSNDRITGAQDPKNLSYSYGYDNNGNFTNISGAVSTQNFSYDNRDRTTQRRDALNQSESWTYDGSSNLSTYTDRKSQKTTYSYDALDRVSKVTYADGNTTSLYYDNGNRLTQAVDSVSGTITRSYDQFDRLTQEQTPQGTVSYTYDAAGRRSTMTAASQAQVSYSYDAANRLTQVSQGSETVSIGYDAANRRTSVTLPNGVVTNYTYDNANQLTNIVYRTSGNAVLSSIAYAYDAAGQRIRKTGGFASDPLTGTTASNSQFDANNRLTQGSGYSFSYDANGDMTQVSIPVTYIFDARHRLSAVSQNGSVVHSFSYDVFGRRTSKTIFGTTTTFLYDGANPVQETQGGAISSILNGLGIDERYARSEAAGRRYFLTDALGSTVALTDASANVVQTYAYEPYGKVAASGSSANPYQYAGRENDGNGLYYYRARYYSHGWQRFFSEDPIGLVGGLNAYAYVNGNPMSYSDPSGRVWQYAGAAVVGGLFGGVVNGLNYFSLGCSFWKGFENGFAGGAVTGIATVAGQPILGGAAGGAVTTYLNRQDGVMVSPNPYVDIGIGATAGGIGSWVGGNVGSILTSDWGIYAAGSQELGDFIGNVAGASAGTGINNAFNTSSTMNGDSPPCRCQ